MKIPKIFKHYKIIGIIVVILILGFVFRSQIKSKVAPEPSFKTAKVKKTDLNQTISASGKIKSDEEATLKFQTSGYLSWVGVKKGDKVKKWQAIAALDKEKLEQTLKQDLIDYMNERWDFDQEQDDYHTGGEPPAKVALNDEMKRILEKSQFDLNRTVIDVEIKNLALKYANLWTPIDGIVTEVETPNAGVNITAATAEFVVSNPDKMYFAGKVDEADVGQINPDMKAEILLDAYPNETFESSISQIGFTSTTTSSGGTAYEVKFLLPENINERFRIGMNGDADIIVSEKQEVLVVPFEAIQDIDGKEYVWILPEDNVPVKKEVKTGLGNDYDTEILEGINEGDKVVTSDFKLLKTKYNRPNNQ